jgi:hypothetical protein
VQAAGPLTHPADDAGERARVEVRENIEQIANSAIAFMIWPAIRRRAESFEWHTARVLRAAHDDWIHGAGLSADRDVRGWIRSQSRFYDGPAHRPDPQVPVFAGCSVIPRWTPAPRTALRIWFAFEARATAGAHEISQACAS